MYFNPRSREGSDVMMTSMHAVKLYFNPRSREGSDVKPLLTYVHTVLFQSTLPRRERQPSGVSQFIYLIHFNPRSREGSDLCKLCKESAFLAISIHAPAKGATVLYWLFIQ